MRTPRFPGRWNRRAVGWSVFVGGVVLVYLGTSLALVASVPSDWESASSSVPDWPSSVRGTLMIVGGGGLPDSVKARFLKLAGGAEARLVVIPTAGEWADDPGWDAADPWRRRGVRSVKVLHTRDRARADSRAFCRAIDEATAVWISGGHQSSLSAPYAGTEVERALRRLLDRGGVIGGTSAGASVLSRVMMDGDGVGVGFDLAPGLVIDQHFLKRNRMGRLARVLDEHGDLIGLGIDEATAIELDLTRRRIRVIGDSYALICVPAMLDSEGEFRIEILKSGDEADLGRIRDRSARAVLTRIDIDGL